MLVNGRHEMVRRAIRSFEAQTYPACRLILYDTSPADVRDLQDIVGIPLADREDIEVFESSAIDHHGERKTIGHLRNRANACDGSSDIILHWDSDDWSHPRRIEEQVALLQQSGADCVGYREMLFWDTRPGQFCGAYLYSHPLKTYCIGTSLCYWRRVWEQKPFPDLPNPKGGHGGTGEDDAWHKQVTCAAVKSCEYNREATITGDTLADERQPRMIASIHGSNTMHHERNLAANSPQWKRAPGWDIYCREKMQL